MLLLSGVNLKLEKNYKTLIATPQSSSILFIIG